MLDAVIEAVRDAGKAREDRGALRIAQGPADGPEALHVLFPPLYDELRGQGESSLGDRSPTPTRPG
jgi:hypothetical protein